MFNDETLHTWLHSKLMLDKQKWRVKEKEKSKLKAIRQNKVVIKIIVNSAISCKNKGGGDRTDITCVPH